MRYHADHHRMQLEIVVAQVEHGIFAAGQRRPGGEEQAGPDTHINSLLIRPGAQECQQEQPRQTGRHDGHDRIVE